MKTVNKIIPHRSKIYNQTTPDVMHITMSFLPDRMVRFCSETDDPIKLAEALAQMITMFYENPEHILRVAGVFMGEEYVQ